MDDLNCNPQTVEKEKPFRAVSFHNIYNTKVLVTNWDYPRQAEPRDHDPYQRPGYNNFKASYDRWGPFDCSFPESTTQEMYNDLYRKRIKVPEHLFKPMLSFWSYPTTECLSWKEHVEEVKKRLPESHETNDYLTVTQVDFPYPRWLRKKRVAIKEKEPKPEMDIDPRLKNCRMLSEFRDALRRKGSHKFLDDNIEEFHQNAEYRSERYVSFDPLRGIYTNESISK